MSDPTPVEVVAPNPIPVVLAPASTEAVPGRMPRQNQTLDPSLPARTTYQEDMTTAGQRAINVIWETTQARIALYVVFGALAIDGVVVIISMLLAKDLTAAQALALGFVNTTASGVISFYFSRTNHAAIGGVGPKAEGAYQGR
jgi:hypothetical protein